MQKIMLAAIGVASLLADPAFAQGASPATGTSSPTSGASTSQSLQQVQQKITNDLRNDGYQDVRVIPNSFLVHAKNKQGDPVVMIINPDSVFAVTGMPANQSANSPNSTGHTGSGLASNSNGATTKQ